MRRRALGVGSTLVAGVLYRGMGAAGSSDALRAPQRLDERRRPVVVCGPSGVGKGTLLSRLMGEYPEDFGFSVSHTTRSPRAGERDGVHYHFCKKEDMEAMIARGEFIEHARVHANLYGTSIAAVKAVSDAGKTCLLDIDVQGAESVKKTDLCARFLFVAPPSMPSLEERLRGRGTESEDKIALRLQNARTEMAYLDKPGFFDNVIVNDDLDASYAKLKEWVLVSVAEK